MDTNYNNIKVNDTVTFDSYPYLNMTVIEKKDEVSRLDLGRRGKTIIVETSLNGISNLKYNMVLNFYEVVINGHLEYVNPRVHKRERVTYKSEVNG